MFLIIFRNKRGVSSVQVHFIDEVIAYAEHYYTDNICFALSFVLVQDLHKGIVISCTADGDMEVR